MAKDTINWISEDEALKRLFNGWSRKTLRVYTRDEKRRKLPIRTKKLNHKTFLYSGTDIDNFINS